VVAARSGTVNHVSYGAAFGSRQLAVVCSDGTEDFYAHMSSRVADGTKVSAGDRIGTVGADGNTTGPHLHFERHKKAGSWSCSNMDDPAKSHAAGSTSASSGEIPAGEVYLSKLKYGQDASDSVKRLQQQLNKHGSTITQMPITGGYFDMTDTAVRACQKSHDFGEDPVKGSYVGPKQAEHLFAGSGNTIKNDLDAPVTGKPKGPYVEKLRTALLGVPKVAYVVGWDDPDRSDGSGKPWNPVWILLHHTAGTNSLGVLKPGGNHDGVAAANFLVDRDGTIRVISAYLSYHAGLGGPMGEVPKDKMNEWSWGIEVESLGAVKDFTDDQMLSIQNLLKALVAMMKTKTEKITNHKTWSSTGKVDTRYSDAFWRELAVGTFRPEGPVEPPVTEPPPVVTPPVVPPQYLTKAAADMLYATRGHSHPAAAPGDADAMWFDYTDKPSAAQVIPGDAAWHLVTMAALQKVPYTGFESHMLYVRVNFRWKSVTGTVPTTMAALVKAVAAYQGKVEARFVRGDGDATAYDERHFTYGTNSVPFQHLHWEHGEKGLAGKWYLRVHGGLTSVELTTRYAKTNVIVAR
jgi:peptidoglycan hydrolase-like protein with peptidoglycan-binding domain